MDRNAQSRDGEKPGQLLLDIRANAKSLSMCLVTLRLRSKQYVAVSRLRDYSRKSASLWSVCYLGIQQVHPPGTMRSTL